MQSTDQKGASTAVAASTVGSTLGDVIIRAGQQYTQVGSDLLTPAGNVDVQAQSLLVKEARATARVQTETKFKQGGLTIGVSGGVISAIESAQQLKEATENTSSGRMQTLAAATTALQWHTHRTTPSARDTQPFLDEEARFSAGVDGGQDGTKAASTGRQKTAQGEWHDVSEADVGEFGGDALLPRGVALCSASMALGNRQIYG